MSIRDVRLVLAAVAIWLGGCSLVAYSPVVATAAVGAHRTDLSDQAPYRDYVGRPLRLVPAAAADWRLQRFRGGRYLIGRALPGDTKIIVCALDDAGLRITTVFRDTINDGVFFSAEVDCAGVSYSAPLNHWTADLENALRFADQTETP